MSLIIQNTRGTLELECTRDKTRPEKSLNNDFHNSLESRRSHLSLSSDPHSVWRLQTSQLQHPDLYCLATGSSHQYTCFTINGTSIGQSVAVLADDVITGIPRPPVTSTMESGPAAGSVSESDRRLKCGALDTGHPGVILVDL